MQFVESGMIFGPFPEGCCFRIEESQTYKKVGDDVKIAEFALIRDSAQGINLLIVEAKNSSPRPETLPNFPEFIEEIHDKLANALQLTLSCVLGRHQSSDSEPPDRFHSLDLKELRVRLILVINGHKREWLPPLHDALNKEMRALVKIWALGPNSVAVINHEMAAKKKLIISQDPSAGSTA